MMYRSYLSFSWLISQFFLLDYLSCLNQAYALIGSPWLYHVQISTLNNNHSACLTTDCTSPAVGPLILTWSAEPPLWWPFVEHCNCTEYDLGTDAYFLATWRNYMGPAPWNSLFLNNTITNQFSKCAILMPYLTEEVAVHGSDALIRPSGETPYDDLKKMPSFNDFSHRRQEAWSSCCPTAGSFSVISTASCAVFIPTWRRSKEKKPGFHKAQIPA